MTEIEARGKIKYRIANEMRKAGENKEEYEDLEIALQVMKEIREYRELGTVEDIKSFFNENRKAGYNHGYSDGYEKAIDEFAEKLKAVCDSIIKEERNHHARPISWAIAYEDFKDDIDDIVVQLKE